MLAKQLRQIKLMRNIKEYFREKKGKEIKNVDLNFYKNREKHKYQIDIFYGKDEIEMIDFHFLFPSLINFIKYRYKKYYIKRKSK